MFSMNDSLLESSDHFRCAVRIRVSFLSVCHSLPKLLGMFLCHNFLFLAMRDYEFMMSSGLNDYAARQ
jgi:hypothetical protein